MAKVKGVLTKLMGPQSMARQFFVWTIASELVSALMTPLVNIVTVQANMLVQTRPHTPESLAGMVTRGIAGKDWATKEATKSGMSPENFALLVQHAGMPPSIGDMLLLMRRGKVSRDAVIRAIRQSSIKDEWIDTILMLGVQPPTPTDILEAYLEGQVDEGRARELYASLGGDPEFFTLLYNTRGQPPTPLQAADMAARGVIPWEGTGPDAVSFEQAFLEGPWRNKWQQAFRRTADYIPEPRTITAMVNEGSITREKGRQLLIQQHVPADMLDAFLFDASSQKTKAARELTIGTISSLYQEQAITDEIAAGMLGQLRYEPDEASFIILSWRLARELRYRNTAINTVHTQFTNHKINQQAASMLLDQFHVPASQRDALLALWTLEEGAKVVILTATQVRTAFRKEVITAEDAIQRLVDMGYSPDDAGIFMQL